MIELQSTGMEEGTRNIYEGRHLSFFPPLFVSLPSPHKGIMMATLFEMAEEIIDKRGGDEYKRKWLQHWLSDPDHEDEFMSMLLKKQVSEAAKKKKDAGKPNKIKL